MIDIGKRNCVVDIDNMICINVENEVTIKMQKEGESLKGKLSDMPMDLFAEIAKYGNGEGIIENIVKMAENEYFKAYTEKA